MHAGMIKAIDSKDLQNVTGGFGLSDFYARGPKVTRWMSPGGNVTVYAGGRNVTSMSGSATMR